MKIVRADGKIIIDTEVDSKGADKGINETRSKVAKLAAEYTKQGDSMSEAMKKAWAEVKAESDKQAEQTPSGWRKAFDNIKSIADTGFGVVKTVVGTAAKAIGAFGKSALDTGMEFESAMHQVGATMGLSREEINKGSEDFERMKQTARDFGKTTKFSATECANALDILTLAGFKTQKAIDTLPAVLDLAAAGGIGLKDATEIITRSMHSLGIQADGTGKFVDKMAKTAQKSGTNIEELGRAINTVGATAKMMAGDTNELCVVLGVLADNGMTAEDGGIRVRNMLLSLANPTDEAAQKM